MKVISVEDVSKKFVLSHTRSTNLADVARNVFSRAPREDFWALKDISFDVQQGEAIGIIGHNGAGKSTMLKLLTRIMYPTTGRIRTRGRISALIEVGAGFHPEMTGRENIYLNGSILGMTHREISSKFDDVVAFAELERFIDTPVKRYSSGMYARLGFSVAAHVDPEILLVDEVLSVGDERFQVRCQERMASLMKGGATVVFVSHNLPSVAALCSRCLVLSMGECVYNGDSAEGVRLARRLLGAPAVSGDGDVSLPPAPVQILQVRVLDAEDREVQEIATGAALTIQFACKATEDMPALNFGLELLRADGVKAYDVNSRMDGYTPAVKAGDFVVNVRMPACNLSDGFYFVNAGIMDKDEYVHYHLLCRCTHFAVRDELLYRGIARLGHSWDVSEDAGERGREVRDCT